MSSGFEIIPAVLGGSDIAVVATALRDDGVYRSRAGARHLMSHPAVRNVARDPRLLAIAKRFLGVAPIPYRATLFDKSPQHNWLVAWHQDTALPVRERRDVAGWGPWSVKAGITYARAPAAALSGVVALRLHIDDSRADNGPLRVIPGTHALGILSGSDIRRVVARAEPVDCVAASGSVVAMRPLILHASRKVVSDRPRRVLHIEYADSLHIGDGLELAIA